MRSTIHRMRSWVPLLLAAAIALASNSSPLVEASSDITSTRSSYGNTYAIRATAAASQQRGRQLYGRYSNSGDDPTPPQQIRIRPFTLVLKPSSMAFNLDELPTLHDAIQHVIEEHIRKVASGLDYVLLGDILELTKRNAVQDVNNGKNSSPMRKNAGGGATWTGDGSGGDEVSECIHRYVGLCAEALSARTRGLYARPWAVQGDVRDQLPDDQCRYLHGAVAHVGPR